MHGRGSLAAFAICHIMRVALTLWPALLSSAALGALPTFRIAEVHSNLDGSVQFIRLSETDGLNGQHHFAGLALTRVSRSWSARRSRRLFADGRRAARVDRDLRGQGADIGTLSSTRVFFTLIQTGFPYVHTLDATLVARLAGQMVS